MDDYYSPITKEDIAATLYGSPLPGYNFSERLADLFLESDSLGCHTAVSNVVKHVYSTLSKTHTAADRPVKSSSSKSDDIGDLIELYRKAGPSSFFNKEVSEIPDDMNEIGYIVNYLNKLEGLVLSDLSTISELLRQCAHRGSTIDFLLLVWALLHMSRHSSGSEPIPHVKPADFKELTCWAVPGMDFLNRLRHYASERKRLRLFSQEPYLLPLFGFPTTFSSGELAGNCSCAIVTHLNYFEFEISGENINGIRIGYMLSADLTHNMDDNVASCDCIWLLDGYLKCLLQSSNPSALLKRAPASVNFIDKADIDLSEPPRMEERKSDLFPGVDPQYHSFMSMRRVGVPDAAVRRHMELMGLASEGDLEIVFGTNTKSSSCAQSESDTTASATADESGDVDFFGFLFADAEKNNEIAQLAEAKRESVIASLNGTPLKSDSFEWKIGTKISCSWVPAENKLYFFADGLEIGLIENVLSPDFLQQQQTSTIHGSDTMVPGKLPQNKKMWPVICCGEGAKLLPHLSSASCGRVSVSIDEHSTKMKDVLSDNSTCGIGMPCLRLLNGPIFSISNSNENGVEVNFGARRFLPKGSFSVAACVRLLPGSGIDESIGQVVCSFQSSGELGRVCFTVLSCGRLRLDIQSIGTYESSVDSDFFDPKIWHYLVVTFNLDSKEVLFFVDSVSMKSALRPVGLGGKVELKPSCESSFFYIGKDGSVSGNMDDTWSALCGDICDVRLWNLCISTSRILLCKKRGSLNPLLSDLVGYWKLSEGCGNYVYNSALERSSKVERFSVSSSKTDGDLPPPPGDRDATVPLAPSEFAHSIDAVSCGPCGALLGSWYWVNELSSTEIVVSSHNESTNGQSFWSLGKEENPLDHRKLFLTAKSSTVFPFIDISSDLFDIASYEGDPTTISQALSSICKYLLMSSTHYLEGNELADLKAVQQELQVDSYLCRNPIAVLECMNATLGRILQWFNDDSTALDYSFEINLLQVITVITSLIKSFMSKECISTGCSQSEDLRRSYCELCVAVLPFLSIDYNKFVSIHSIPGDFNESISTSVLSAIVSGFPVFCPTPRARTLFITSLFLRKFQVAGQIPILNEELLSSTFASFMTKENVTLTPIEDVDFIIPQGILNALSISLCSLLLNEILEEHFTSIESVVSSFIAADIIASSTKRYNGVVTTDIICFPYAVVGDFVILKDAKGNVDDPAVTGFVVDVIDWNNQPRSGVLVLWPDGSTQSYCYGGMESLSKEGDKNKWTPRYDVKIVLSKFRAMTEIRDQPLWPYSPEEVDSCLLHKPLYGRIIGYETILKTLRRYCPLKVGLELGIYDLSLDMLAEDGLGAVRTLSNLYRLAFEQCNCVNTARDFPESFDTDLLLSLLVADCNSCCNSVSPTVKLLCTLQSFICGAIDDRTWSNAGTLKKTQCLFVPGYGPGINKSTISELLTPDIDGVKWDWEEGTWTYDAESADIDGQSSSVMGIDKRTLVSKQAVISNPLSFKDSESGTYVFQDSRRRKVSISRHQKWSESEMCVLDAVMTPNSGCYDWVIHVEKFRKKDHMLLGAVNANAAMTKVVGSESWFLNRDGVVIRGGSPRFDEQHPSCSFGGGESLHFHYNSYSGTLKILIGSKNKSKHQPRVATENSDENIHHLVVISIPQEMSISPCVCLFSRGDLLSTYWEEYLGPEVWGEEMTGMVKTGKADKTNESIRRLSCRNRGLPTVVSNRSPFAAAKSLGKSVTSAIVQGPLSRCVSSPDETFLVCLKGCVPDSVMRHCSYLLYHGSVSLLNYKLLAADETSTDVLPLISSNPLFTHCIPCVLSSIAIWQYTRATDRSIFVESLRKFIYLVTQHVSDIKSLENPGDVKFRDCLCLGNQLILVSLSAMIRLLSADLTGEGILNKSDVGRRGVVYSRDVKVNEETLRSMFESVFPRDKYFSTFEDFTAISDLANSTVTSTQYNSLFRGRLDALSLPTVLYKSLLFDITESDFNGVVTCEKFMILFIEWLQKTDGVPSSVRKIGGVSMRDALWKIFYITLYHSGSLALADALCCRLRKLDDISLKHFFDSHVPFSFLLKAWQRANDCRLWAVQISQNYSGDNNFYDLLSSIILCKTNFLTMFGSFLDQKEVSDLGDTEKLYDSLGCNDSYFVDAVNDAASKITSFIKFANEPLVLTWCLCLAKERACNARSASYAMIAELLSLSNCPNTTGCLSWVSKCLLVTLFADSMRDNICKHHFNSNFSYVELDEKFSATPRLSCPKGNILDDMRQKWLDNHYLESDSWGINIAAQTNLRASLSSVYMTLAYELKTWHEASSKTCDIFAIQLMDAMCVSISRSDLDMIVASDIVNLLITIVSEHMSKNELLAPIDLSEISVVEIDPPSHSIARAAVRLFSAIFIQILALARTDYAILSMPVMFASFDFVYSTLVRLVKWSSSDHESKSCKHPLTSDMSVLLSEMTHFLLVVSAMGEQAAMYLHSADWIVLLLNLISLTTLTAQQRTFRILKNVLKSISRETIGSMSVAPLLKLKAQVKYDCSAVNVETLQPSFPDLIVEYILSLIARYAPVNGGRMHPIVLKSVTYTSESMATELSESSKSNLNSMCRHNSEGLTYYHASCCISEGVSFLTELSSSNCFWKNSIEATVGACLAKFMSESSVCAMEDSGISSINSVAFACFCVIGGYRGLIYPCCLVSMPVIDGSSGLKAEAKVDLLNNVNVSLSSRTMGSDIGKFGVVLSIQDKKDSLIVYCAEMPPDLSNYCSIPAQSVSVPRRLSKVLNTSFEITENFLGCLQKLLIVGVKDRPEKTIQEEKCDDQREPLEEKCGEIGDVSSATEIFSAYNQISMLLNAALTAFRNLCLEKSFCDIVLRHCMQHTFQDVLQTLFHLSIKNSSTHGLIDISIVEDHLSTLLHAISIDGVDMKLRSVADVPDFIPTDKSGHRMPFTTYSPGPHNPRGYISGWACDICKNRSVKMAIEWGSGRFHCTECSADICVDCCSDKCFILSDSNGHPMPYTRFKPGPENDPGYEIGWVCDKCRKESMHMPSDISAGRYHCRACQSDICIKCAKAQNATISAKSAAPCLEESVNRDFLAEASKDAALREWPPGNAEWSFEAQDLSDKKASIPSEETPLFEEGQQFSTDHSSLFGQAVPYLFDETNIAPTKETAREVDEANIEMLVHMGFSRNVCESALLLCGNDLNEAINHLLNNGVDDENDEENGDIDEGIMDLFEDAGEVYSNHGSLRSLPEATLPADETISRPTTSRGASFSGRSGNRRGRSTGRGRGGGHVSYAFIRGTCESGDSCEANHTLGDSDLHDAKNVDPTNDFEVGAWDESQPWGADEDPDSDEDESADLSTTSRPDDSINVLGIYFVNQAPHDPVMFVYTSPSTEAERICYFRRGDEVVPLEIKDDNDNIWVKVHPGMINQTAAGTVPDFSLTAFGWILAADSARRMLLSSKHYRNADISEILQISFKRNSQYVSQDALPVLSNCGGNMIAEIPRGTLLKSEMEFLHPSGLILVHVNLDDKLSGVILKYPGSMNIVDSLTDQANDSLTPGSDKTGGLVFSSFPEEHDVTVLEAKPEVVSPEKLLSLEIDMFRRVKDDMESLRGSAVHSKEDRLFGSLQGNDMPLLVSKEEEIAGTSPSRRSKLFGGNFNRYSILKNVERAEAVLSEDINTLVILNCRQIMLSMFLRSFAVHSDDSEDAMSVLTKVLMNDHIDDVSSGCEGLAKNICAFIILVIFRGIPLSCNPVEDLAVLPYQVLGLKSGIWGTEFILGAMLSRFLSKMPDELGNGKLDIACLHKSFRFNMLYLLSRQLRQACSTAYVDFNFSTATYWNHKDKDLDTLPNTMVAKWLTKTLTNSLKWRRETNDSDIFICRQLFQLWCLALRSPSMSLQLICFTELSDLLSTHHNNIIKFGGDEVLLAKLVDALNYFLDLLPIDRLLTIGQKRLFYELEDDPAYSRYLDGLLDLLCEYDGIITVNRAGFRKHQLAATGSDCLHQDGSFMGKQIVNTFACPESRISLQPQQDFNGAWTVEFWLYRTKDLTCTKSNCRSDMREAYNPAESSVEESKSCIKNNAPALPALNMSMTQTFDTSANDILNESRRIAPSQRRSASWAFSSSVISQAFQEAAGIRMCEGAENEKFHVNDEALHFLNMDLDAPPAASPVLSRARTEDHSQHSPGNIISSDLPRSGMTRSNRFSSLVHSILRTQREARSTLDLMRTTGEIVDQLRDGKVETPEIAGSVTSNASTSSSAPGIDLINSEYLLHSPSAFIRLQRGGLFQKTNMDDPLQTQEFVPDAALCMSVCTRGESHDTVLDVVVPFEKWTHIALSYRGTSSKILDVFINGEMQESVNNLKMVLPLCTVGYDAGGLGPSPAEKGSLTGAMQGHKSFQGHLSELRVWSAARTEYEIARDMYRDINGMKDLLGLLRHQSTPAKIQRGDNVPSVTDVMCYWNSCSLSDCTVTEIEGPTMRPPFPDHLKFIGCSQEEAEGIFGEEIGISCGLISWTGVFRNPWKIEKNSGGDGDKSSFLRKTTSSVSSKSSHFANREVINICYKKISGEDAASENIEGYIEWCSYGTRSLFSGKSSKNGPDHNESIYFTIEKENVAVVGPIEDLTWLEAMRFDGAVVEGGAELSGSFTVSRAGHALPPLIAGQMRLDRNVLDMLGATVELSIEPMTYQTQTQGRLTETKMMETIKVLSEMSMKALFSVHIKPYQRYDRNCEVFPPLEKELSVPTKMSGCDCPIGEVNQSLVYAMNSLFSEYVAEEDAKNIENDVAINDESFGLQRSCGIYYASWIVRSNPSRTISFGVCASAAMQNPDKINKNSDTWTYSCDGRVTHGRMCSFIDKFDVGDMVTIEIDTFFNGSISFYKNGKRVFEFHDINRHPAMAIAPDSSSKDQSTLGIRPFCYMKQKGSSVSFAQIQSAICKPLINDHLIRIPLPHDDHLGRKVMSGRVYFGSLFGPGCLLFHRSNGFWRTFWWQGVQHGVQLWVITRDNDNIVQKKGKEIENPSEIHSIAMKQKAIDAAVDISATTFMAENVHSVFDLVKDLTVLAVRAFLYDRGVCLRELSESETIPYISEFTEELKNVSYTAEVSEATENIGETKSGDQNGADVTSPLFNLHDDVAAQLVPVAENKIGQLTAEEIKELKLKTKAPYILRVIYENGATIREGVDIDSTSVVSSLAYGDVVESFERAMTSEGIGRYRIHNGWISEKLRGGKEELVVEVLQHIPSKPLLFKVTRSDGAKVRRDISLNSPELGIIPGGTIVEVVHTEILEENEKCTRLLIKKPAKWKGGWISEKKHIVTRVDVAVEMESENESRRRAAVRANRAKRLQAKSRLNIERSGATRGMIPVTEHHVVKFSSSSETFFLLGGYGSRCSLCHNHNNSDSVVLSDDLTTATVSGGRGGQNRQMVLGSRGFQRGVHYWEVEVGNAQWGSVFIGVAPYDSSAWNGYGFLNYRAVQSFGKETIYGSYYNPNDTIGVLLDMDHGTITFFKDVEDYSLGKVIAMDLGVAYHYLRRNNKSVAPILFPCFGMANQGDSLTIRKSRWVSRSGLGKAALLAETIRARVLMSAWSRGYALNTQLSASIHHDLYLAYLRWRRQGTLEVRSRAGIPIFLNTSNEALMSVAGNELCEIFILKIGMRLATPHGDSKLLGTRRGQIWYMVLGEATGAWYWTKDQLTNLFHNGTVRVADHGNDIIEAPDPLNSVGNSHIMDNDQRVDHADITIISASARESSSCYEKYEILSEEDFVSYLTGREAEGGSWSKNEDAALASLVNEISIHLDMDPLRISAEVLVAYHHGVRSTSGSPRGMALGADIAHHQHQHQHFFGNEGGSLANLLCRRSAASLEVRYSALCVLNKAAVITLPSTDLSRNANVSSLVTTSFDLDFLRDLLVSTGSFVTMTDSALYTSLSGRVYSNLKNIVFSRLKLDVWNRALKETTTFTPPPADEYERPDDIKEIPLNRMEALAVKSTKDKIPFPDVFRKSLFGQLYNGLHSYDDRLLRRAYIHKENAGQARAFFVSFVGEGVADHSGPYRAAFEVAVGEEPCNLLDLLIPSPNAKGGIGDMRDLVVFNPNISESEKSIWLYNFMGKLIGMACRHKIMLPLTMPPLYWKSLCREILVSTDLQAIDELMLNTLRMIKAMVNSTADGANEELDDSTAEELEEMLAQLLATVDISIPEGNAGIAEMLRIGGCETVGRRLTRDVVKNICSLLEMKALTAHARGLYELHRGLSSVLPTELFSIFTEDELSDLICGRPEVDIAQLRRCAEYEEIGPNDSHVGYFWDALEQMSSDEISGFINFCSGRSRLPQNPAEKTNLKLTGPPPRSEDNPDNYLPIAQTCFFSVSLPKYTSSKVCLQKLRYAIQNAHSMDADFVMRNANGWENI